MNPDKVFLKFSFKPKPSEVFRSPLFHFCFVCFASSFESFIGK